jgi:hypothetical protein
VMGLQATMELGTNHSSKQKKIFVTFMKDLIPHAHLCPKNLIMLVLDNHSLHIGCEVLDMRNKNGTITVLCFPLATFKSLAALGCLCLPLIQGPL